MAPFTTWKRIIVRVLERVLARFHEGPTPPTRLADHVALFAMMNPDAQVDDWRRFAESFAEESYRVGFARGYEWRERAEDPYPEERRIHPKLAVALQRGFDPADPMGGVASPDKQRFIAMLERVNVQHAGED